jgi:RNA polymerase sigma-70 factor (ECF subfamily)
VGLGNNFMREITYSEFEAAAREAEENLHMDEERFRIFYERTARPLWCYLSRVSGNPSLADDLVQETYCRFLTGARQAMSEEHQRNYLFRIAGNLLRDHWRRTASQPPATYAPDRLLEIPCDERTAEQVQIRQDVGRALARLKPRERALLWLAYVLGSSHKEIAEALGLKAPSIRLLLFRARRKLADLLRHPVGRAPRTNPGPEDSKVIEL